MAWLRGTDFCATRGERRLFEGVAFQVDRGQALLLRGPNGSGKSTLLRSLVGLASLDAGVLEVGGSRFEATSRRLCPLALFQGHASGLKGELGAAHCLRYCAELDGSPFDDAAIENAMGAMELAHLARVEVRRLSQGQKQRLTLCRLVLAAGREPERRPLWLLDEPSAALDQAGAARLDALVAAHLDAGFSAIIATHLPLPGIATRSTVLEFRSLAVEASP